GEVAHLARIGAELFHDETLSLRKVPGAGALANRGEDVVPGKAVDAHHACFGTQKAVKVGERLAGGLHHSVEGWAVDVAIEDGFIKGRVPMSAASEGVHLALDTIEGGG